MRELKIDVDGLKQMLAYRCETCTPESDLCPLCTAISVEASRASPPFTSFLMYPPTLYGMLCGDPYEPVEYSKVIMGLLVAIGAQVSACSPDTEDFNEDAADARDRAFPLVDVETQVMLTARKEYADAPSELTYLRMIEAEASSLQALLFSASDSEPESTLRERVELRSQQIFEFCGSIFIQPVKPLSNYHAYQLGLTSPAPESPGTRPDEETESPGTRSDEESEAVPESPGTRSDEESEAVPESPGTRSDEESESPGESDPDPESPETRPEQESEAAPSEEGESAEAQ